MTYFQNIMLTTRGPLKGYNTLGEGSFYSPFKIMNISDKYVTSKLSFQSWLISGGS